MTVLQTSNPFRLPLKQQFFARIIERLLGLDILARCYDDAPKDSGAISFLQHVLSWLGVTVCPVDGDNTLASLPSEGPLLIVANHPLGGLEGVAITRMLLEYRPDTKVLTNELLTRIPELADIFIGVDVLSGRPSRASIRGLRVASNHLQEGGALLVFPAGKVAQFDRKSRLITDHPWNRIAGQLAKNTSATCLPIHVDGRNSKLFYFMAMLHPKLRTLLLPRELANKRNLQLKLLVGKPVATQELRHLGDAQAVTDYLRMSTEFIKNGCEGRRGHNSRQEQPIAESGIDASSSLAELKEYRLIETDRFDVYCAPYIKLGVVIEHIGVAREITFRAAGEGTGNRIDSDRYDPHYLHLFIWDKTAERLVGGYRIGRSDEIVASCGLDGLYSRTLYDFDQGYLDKIGPCLEMGRSFVHPDYQRLPMVLDLLWRGIGTYVAKNPEYHTLFGAVSISREHSDLARALIAECMLESFCAEQKYLQDVSPLEPLKVRGKIWSREMLVSLNHISLVNKLVGRCDPGKSLPTLLRHYLSLNGKFVCFSVNKVFNESLDGLILVDLRKTPRKYLNRYLGKDGAQTFLEKWQVIESVPK